MNSIHNRILFLRNTLKLSQEQFAQGIGITKTSVSNIERGTSKPSNLTLKAICREYYVNYHWLVYGEGQIFIILPDAGFDLLAIEYALEEESVEFIKNFVCLPKKTRLDIIKVFQIKKESL